MNLHEIDKTTKTVRKEKKKPMKKDVTLKKVRVFKNDEAIEKTLDDAKKIVELMNLQLDYALEVFKISPSSTVLDAVNGELSIENKFGKRLSALEAAKSSNIEKEYLKLVTMEREITTHKGYKLVKKYLKWSKAKGFSLDTKIRPEMEEMYSKYITHPETIKAYESALNFIETYDHFADASGIGDRAYKNWRIGSITSGFIKPFDNPLELEPSHYAFTRMDERLNKRDGLQ